MDDKPKSKCCNAPIHYYDTKGDGTPGSPANAIFIWCSHCLELMDANGYKLISLTEKGIKPS